MDVTPVVSPEQQLIAGYGDLGFTISGIRHEGSVIVLPKQTISWAVASMAELTIASLEPLLTAEPRPSVLMLGCGKGMAVVPRDIRAALKAAGIVVEPMDTGAACRTYNVLLTEGRDVAAALIAV
jgi:uncharacterized protein